MCVFVVLLDLKHTFLCGGGGGRFGRFTVIPSVELHGDDDFFSRSWYRFGIALISFWLNVVSDTVCFVVVNVEGGISGKSFFIVTTRRKVIPTATTNTTTIFSTTFSRLITPKRPPAVSSSTSPLMMCHPFRHYYHHRPLVKRLYGWIWLWLTWCMRLCHSNTTSQTNSEILRDCAPGFRNLVSTKSSSSSRTGGRRHCKAPLSVSSNNKGRPPAHQQLRPLREQ